MRHGNEAPAQTDTALQSAVFIWRYNRLAIDGLSS
jgi:hypothetical protein